MFRFKPLRLGNFRSILEMLGADAAGERPPAGPAVPPRRPSAFETMLDSMPASFETQPYMPIDRLARIYGEARPDAPQPAFRPANDALIAAELGLGSARSRAELRRIRRDFARRNHPDRVPAWLRDEATRRMTIANALIDGALRSMKAAQP